MQSCSVGEFIWTIDHGKETIAALTFMLLNIFRAKRPSIWPADTNVEVNKQEWSEKIAKAN